MKDLDTASLLFSFPDDIVISSVRATTTEVVLHTACRRPCAACPLCQQPSERVHGHYGRTVADLLVNAPKPLQFLRLQPAHVPPILHSGTKVPGKAVLHLASWNGMVESKAPGTLE